MENLAISKALPFLRSIKGRMFSATFTKKDGTIRRMTCRMSVSKGVKGTGNYSHTKDTRRNNVTVYEMAAGGRFRAIPLDRVISLRVDGTQYQIV